MLQCFSRAGRSRVAILVYPREVVVFAGFVRLRGLRKEFHPMEKKGMPPPPSCYVRV